MGELKEQSNPFSTGGGGVNFETRVQASFIVALIAETPVPCMPTDARIKEISFQSKYKGVNTDDVHIVGEDSAGKSFRLYVQIKNEVSVSDSADSTFADVMTAAWQDFKGSKFNEQCDAIALVTGPLTKVDVVNTLPILEWARCSASADEFLLKASADGFTSNKKRDRLEKFKSQLTRSNNGIAISDDELWRFFKVFYLISYDLGQAGSVTAALLGSLLKSHSDLPPSAVLAKVVTVAQEFNQNAGTVNAENLPADLKCLFKVAIGQTLGHDVKKLRERSDYILGGISNVINGVHVPQRNALEEIRAVYKPGGFLFVTGERGAGKSGIVKEFVKSIGDDAAVFYVRAEDFDKSHLNDVFAAFGIKSDLSQLANHFSLLTHKILVIESVERILELTNTSAFNDLLSFITGQNGWGVIATGRDYAYQQLSFNYLQSRGISFSSVTVNGFTEEQVRSICSSMPPLLDLLWNASSAALLSNPFYLDLAVRALKNGAQFTAGETQSEFKATIWRSVIENQADRRAGMHSRRRIEFMEIAKHRAKNMVFGVREADYDAEVVAKLEADNLIIKDPRTSLLSPAHDVLEDWALEQFIEDEYQKSLGSTAELFSAIGSEPAINRAFRLWLSQKMTSGSDLDDFIENVLTDHDVSIYWKDEVIAAILQDEAVEQYVCMLECNLLRNNSELLLRFYFVLRLACQRPIEGMRGVLADGECSGYYLWLKPVGPGWKALIDFTFRHRETLGNDVAQHAIDLLAVWAEAISIWSELPPEAPTVGELCLFILEPLADTYRKEELRGKLLRVLLKVAKAIPEQFDALVDRDVFAAKLRHERPGYVGEFVKLALTSDLVAVICRNNPDFVIRLAMHEWIAEEPEEHDEFFPSIPYGRDTFGLEDPSGFFPASGARGPFKYLLQHHPRKGLDFILDLCRISAAKHAASGSHLIGQKIEGLRDEMALEEVVVSAADGTRLTIYASPHLWKAYRGQSTVPYLLQCGLMALENWLVDYIQSPPANNQLAWVFDHVLKSSNSALTVAVLSSVAVGFPKEVGAAAYPILSCPCFYALDLMRGVQDRGGEEINWFFTQRDPMSRLFEEERRVAALRSWRQETLENLLFKLQYDSECQEHAYEIVDGLKVLADSSGETGLKFMVHRLDAREIEAIEIKDKNRIVFKPKSKLGEDLQKIQSEHQVKQELDSSIQRLYVWSKSVFEDSAKKQSVSLSLDDALAEGKRILKLLLGGNAGDFTIMALGAVATTCAVLIRDYIDQLSPEDIGWCVEVACEVIEFHADDIHGHMAVDVTDAHGAAACAFVITKLLSCDLDAVQVEQVKSSMAMAVTHANMHVASQAAKGIRCYLWSIDPDFAGCCLSGAIEYSRFEVDMSCVLRRMSYVGEPSVKEWEDHLANFRADFLDGKFISNPNEISRQTHSLWRVHIPLLMLPFNSESSMHAELLAKIVRLIYEEEEVDQREEYSKRISHDVKKVMTECFAEHVLASRACSFAQVRELLLEGSSKDPTFIYLIKLKYDSAMEMCGDYQGIWELWDLLAPKVKEIALLDVDAPYVGHQNDLNNFVSGMLYGSGVGERHPDRIKAIEVGAGKLIAFFNGSAANSLVFEALCTLIYDFHDLFFDQGIHVLAKEYKNNPRIINARGNTVFCLEMALFRFLQGPDRRISRKLHEACLCLLTGVVETGSARAYYLRESLIKSYRIVA
ncbi:hypothetical protein [Pseudomonas alloputida]|uniref:hypothetical protein n=1 Tax=Pseudomonas TaxID=286 RepID=UPI003EE8F49D